MILGATLNSTSEDQNFNLPDYKLGSVLPSSTIDWLKDEQNWGCAPPDLQAATIIGSLLAGVKPDVHVDDYAFLTIVSATLSHICSFEALTRAIHPELYSNFVSRMSGPLDLLDDMWSERVAGRSVSESLPTPLEQCTRSLLDSAFYHLQASDQLAGMSRLFSHHELLKTPNELRSIAELPQQQGLEKALVRAASSLRIDCRLGLRYVQKVAPHRFAPLSATAVTEGGMCQFLEWLLWTVLPHAHFANFFADSKARSPLVLVSPV